MKPVFSILIILLSFNPLSASEISVVSLLGNSDVKRDAIIIEGEIANQDYKRFLSALNTTYMRNPAGPSRVYLYTLGGDAIEAMKIGRLIRKLRLSTGAPSITSTGDISCCDFKAWRLPISKSNCNCASAGFLIWIAGIERTGNVLGIHRTFIDHGLLRTMSEKAALKYTNQVYDQTGRYLTEMGAGSNLIELIQATPSNDLVYIPLNFIDKYLGGYIREYQEWVIANCGDYNKAYSRVQLFTATHNINNLSSQQESDYNALLNAQMEIVKCKLTLLTKIRTEAYNNEFEKAVNHEKPFYMTENFFFTLFKPKLYLD